MRRADDIHPDEALAYGAYVGLRAPNGCREGAAAADVDGLAGRLGLAGEYEAPADAPKATVAYLRRVSAEAADVDDDTLLDADAVVHVCAPEAGTVDASCAGLRALLPSGVDPHVHRGAAADALHGHPDAQPLQRPSRAAAARAGRAERVFSCR